MISVKKLFTKILNELNRFEVITGTATTSSSGIAEFTQNYLTSDYLCLSVTDTSTSTGTILLPYKYANASGGKWGFRAIRSTTGNAMTGTVVNYTALMYKYT